ncbi:hypothetical protein [Paenibacillus hunanensis]|uniref:Uncharacterized protein n=1 Tax=Paenibacillus hunanensis TaxID=539262 RepID=A0ABU1IXB5_9BACL|nr:hypothetical protein [Paenibacillus hunanensis]MDR6243899.1 hypothetical protein [Paenibacillus hunanensis]GGJ16096.1 hypothetical protein GCM10008022_26650 [Paenibacillus hunanensis]
MIKTSWLLVVLLSILFLTSCSQKENYQAEPIKLQTTDFKHTIASTADRDNLPMATQGSGTTVGIYNVNGKIEETRQYHIKNGAAFKKFISLGNLISADRIYKMIVLVDYKQTKFGVDGNHASIDYTFQMKAGQTLEIPIELKGLKPGMHDVLVVMVKNPDNKSLDEDYRKKTDLNHLITERFNVIVGDSTKPSADVNYTNTGMKEEQNLGGVFLSKENDFKRWLSEDVKSGELMDFFVHVGNSNEKDNQTYALVLLSDWKQIDILDNKDVLYYKLGKNDSYVLPVKYQVPAQAGIKDLTALLIQSPNQKLDMYNRDTEFSIRVGINGE